MTDNHMMVLQNCMDFPKLVLGSCSETCRTSFCDGDEATIVKVEDGTDSQEEKDPLLIHEVSCEAVIVCARVPPPTKS
jgi:hypothetical protein